MDDMTISARETARVGDRLANSAAVLWVTQVFMRVLQVATTTILARLLDPADYGVVSLALVILGFIDLLSNIQVGSAIMKIAELDKKHLDTAFTLNLLRGILIAALIGIIAKPAGHFMHDPRLASVLYVLMLTSILRALENPHFILYSRNLDFTRESKRNTVSLIVGCIVGIAAAFAWHNYWALVINAVASSLVFVVLSYWRVPGRPRLSLAKSGDLFGFGGWIVLVNILDYVNWKLDYLIIGNRIGAKALGA
jgi:PST family polysaccharide transporter